jgi:hypothetical protein
MYGPAVDIGIQYGAFSMTSTYRQRQGRFSVCSRWQKVELPGIETDALPGLLPSERPVSYISFRLVPLVTCGFAVAS